MSDLQQARALIIEAAILSAGEPVTIDRLMLLFEGEEEAPSKKDLQALLQIVTDNYADRGIELKEVANGYRFQAKQAYASALQRLWEKKPARYSRALMETLALVIYKQPITRGEIEDVRGVAVSTHIMKTLVEHEWVKVVGYKEVPGKPALYATTKQFLDYFNLKSLSDLPPLPELTDLDEMGAQLGEQLQLEVNETPISASANEPVLEPESETDHLALLDDLADEIKPDPVAEMPEEAVA